MPMLVDDATRESVIALAEAAAADILAIYRHPFDVEHKTDNSPLTALALKQGGYDWGMLAYSVGFGGSMIWFGSSAGVALSNAFPEARSVGRWVSQGWHVTVAYVVGFFVLLAVMGWQPGAKRESTIAAPHSVQAAAELPPQATH